jgi:hypothetical protein
MMRGSQIFGGLCAVEGDGLVYRLKLCVRWMEELEKELGKCWADSQHID